MIEGSPTIAPPPLPPPPPIPVIENEAPTPLWRELADGTAGPLIKTLVSFALAPLLAGLSIFTAYLLASLEPTWWRSYSGPSDDLIVCTMVIGLLLYIAAVAWVWTRNRRQYGIFWKAGALTIGITIAAIAVAVLTDSTMHSAGEPLEFGIGCFAIALVVLVWVQATRRNARGKPMLNTLDGTIDVRCPSCDYRMVGLHETRCPECGTLYTLDDLVARQHFLSPGQRRRGRTEVSR
jgi:hypothetical protein